MSPAAARPSPTFPAVVNCRARFPHGQSAARNLNRRLRRTRRKTIRPCNTSTWPFRSSRWNPWAGRCHRCRTFRGLTRTNSPPSAVESPVQPFREKLPNQLLVERPQFRHIRPLMAFRVEVVGVELPHPVEEPPVLLVHQVVVSPFAVRRIKRVVTEHVETFVR